MERLNADHIAKQGGAFEPQRRNNFMLQLTPPGGDASIVELSLHTFPFPSDATDVTRIPYVNEERKVAGRTTFAGDGMALVLTDYVDRQTAESLTKWRYLVFDPNTGKTGFASRYKVQAKLVLFAPDGTKERTWTLQGVWPSALSIGEGGDMSSGEPNRITITLQVDLIKMDGVAAVAVGAGA